MPRKEAFPREIAEGIFWINKCISAEIDGNPVHVHLSMYLVVGEDRTLLIDTSVPSLFPEILGQVEEALAGRTLDYLFVTHPEVPHSSAMPLFLERFPELKVVGDLRDYHLYFPNYLDRFVSMAHDSALDLGGKAFRFIDAPIKDLPNSMWGYEETTKAMFVCDGFSFTHSSDQIVTDYGQILASEDDDDAPTHQPGDCALLSSELVSGVDVAKASYVLRRALMWSRFVDADLLFDEVAALLKRYPPTLICPSHGSVIDDIDHVLPVIKETHAVAYSASRPQAG